MVTLLTNPRKLPLMVKEVLDKLPTEMKSGNPFEEEKELYFFFGVMIASMSFYFAMRYIFSIYLDWRGKYIEGYSEKSDHDKDDYNSTFVSIVDHFIMTGFSFYIIFNVRSKNDGLTWFYSESLFLE